MNSATSATFRALCVYLLLSSVFAKDKPNLKSDPNDSGYTSPYLSSINRAAVTKETDDPRARQEAQRENRGGNPRFQFQVLKEAAKERIQFAHLLPGTAASPSSVPQWVNIGPTENNYIQNGVSLHVTDSGRMRSILPDPTNPDVVYLLTSSGGLWKTTNFTAAHPTWAPRTDATITTSGGAAAFGRNFSTIYVGLGDPFQNFHSTAGYMIKTTDGATTFSSPIVLPNVTTIRDVKVDTSGAQDIIFVATDFGLYVSTDSGLTYNRASDNVFLDNSAFGLFSTTVWSLARTSAGWLATTENPAVGDPKTDGVGAIAISTDHGTTWQPITNNNNIFSGAGRTTLGVGVPGDKRVYAFAADTNDVKQLDLFRSEDGGQNWSARHITKRKPTNPNPDQPNLDLMQIQAFYNQMVLVDPTDSSRNTVYLGGELSSVKSSDGGNTWTVIANWLAQFGLPYVHADYHAAAFTLLPGGKSMLFFGTDGGLFTSQDGGATWDNNHNDGIVSLLGYSINSTPGRPETSIMGLQDNGTFVRKGNSDIWEQPIGGDGFGVAWSQANDDVVLATVEFSLIFRSNVDDPLFQSEFFNAFSGIDRNFATFNTALATPRATADPTGHAFFTYTGGAIYQTTDGAHTWVNIGQNGLEPGQPSSGIGAARVFRDTVHGIGVSPEANGLSNVAVVCNAGWVVITHNGGRHWRQTPLIGTVPKWQGFNANVEWADNKTLYVASESPIPGARVAKSTDGGFTFTDSSNGLPDVPVNRVLVSPVDSSTLYAATFLGVYRSTDAGATWSRFGTGLPQVEVRDLYMPPDGSLLRVATYGRGVWETKP